MTTLILLNHSPYGNEQALTALRLAAALAREAAGAVRLCLLSDGVYCALPNQLRPEGSPNIEQMLADLLAAGAIVRACTTCLEHRGLSTLTLIAGIAPTTMIEIAAWTAQADRVVTF